MNYEIAFKNLQQLYKYIKLEYIFLIKLYYLLYYLFLISSTNIIGCNS